MPQASLVATLTDPTKQHALTDIASYSSYVGRPDLDDANKLKILRADLKNLRSPSNWKKVQTYMQFQVITLLPAYIPSTTPIAPSGTTPAYFLHCFNYVYGYFFTHFGHDLWDNHSLPTRAWEYAKVRFSLPLTSPHPCLLATHTT